MKKYMKLESIKTQLKPYIILEKRKTTINHAFASAIAPHDYYNKEKLIKAINLIGQDSENLKCFYCDKPAETWDHIYGLVKNSEFSGYGHVIGNLLPCCKNCNSKKGNRDWKYFLEKKGGDKVNEKIKMLNNYFKKNHLKKIDYNKICPKEIEKLDNIRYKIFKLFEDADKISKKIRERK